MSGYFLLACLFVCFSKGGGITGHIYSKRMTLYPRQFCLSVLCVFVWLFVFRVFVWLFVFRVFVWLFVFRVFVFFVLFCMCLCDFCLFLCVLYVFVCLFVLCVFVWVVCFVCVCVAKSSSSLRIKIESRKTLPLLLLHDVNTLIYRFF